MRSDGSVQGVLAEIGAQLKAAAAQSGQFTATLQQQTSATERAIEVQVRQGQALRETSAALTGLDPSVLDTLAVAAQRSAEQAVALATAASRAAAAEDELVRATLAGDDALASEAIRKRTDDLIRLAEEEQRAARSDPAQRRDFGGGADELERIESLLSRAGGSAGTLDPLIQSATDLELAFRFAGDSIEGAGERATAAQAPIRGAAEAAGHTVAGIAELYAQIVEAQKSSDLDQVLRELAAGEKEAGEAAETAAGQLSRMTAETDRLGQSASTTGGGMSGFVTALGATVTAISTTITAGLALAKTIGGAVVDGAKLGAGALASFVEEAVRAADANERAVTAIAGGLGGITTRARDLFDSADKLSEVLPATDNAIQSLIRTIATLPNIRAGLLVQDVGDAEQFVGKIANIVARLAAISGGDFEEATQRVRLAVQGQIEGLRRSMGISAEQIAREVGLTVDQLQKQPDKIIEALDRLTERLIGDEAIGKLATSFTAQLARIRQTVEDFFEGIGEAGPGEGLTRNLLGRLSGAVSAVREFLAGAFVEGGAGSIAGRIATSIESIVDSVVKAINRIVAAVQEVVGVTLGTTDPLRSLGEVLARIFEGVAGAAEGLPALVDRFSGSIKDVIRFIVGEGGPVLSFLQGIVGLFETLVGLATSFARLIGQVIPTLIQFAPLIAAIAGAFKGAQAGAFLGSIIPGLGTAAGGVGGGLIGAAGGLIGGGIVSKQLEGVAEAFSGLGKTAETTSTRLKGAGDASQGLAEGADKAGRALQSFAEEKLPDAVQGFLNAIREEDRARLGRGGQPLAEPRIDIGRARALTGGGEGIAPEPGQPGIAGAVASTARTFKQETDAADAAVERLRGLLKDFPRDSETVQAAIRGVGTALESVGEAGRITFSNTITSLLALGDSSDINVRERARGAVEAVDSAYSDFGKTLERIRGQFAGLAGAAEAPGRAFQVAGREARSAAEAAQLFGRFTTDALQALIGEGADAARALEEGFTDPFVRFGRESDRLSQRVAEVAGKIEEEYRRAGDAVRTLSEREFAALSGAIDKSATEIAGLGDALPRDLADKIAAVKAAASQAVTSRVGQDASAGGREAAAATTQASGLQAATVATALAARADEEFQKGNALVGLQLSRTSEEFRRYADAARSISGATKEASQVEDDNARAVRELGLAYRQLGESELAKLIEGLTDLDSTGAAEALDAIGKSATDLLGRFGASRQAVSGFLDAVSRAAQARALPEALRETGVTIERLELQASGAIGTFEEQAEAVDLLAVAMRAAAPEIRRFGTELAKAIREAAEGAEGGGGADALRKLSEKIREQAARTREEKGSGGEAQTQGLLSLSRNIDKTAELPGADRQAELRRLAGQVERDTENRALQAAEARTSAETRINQLLSQRLQIEDQLADFSEDSFRTEALSIAIGQRLLQQRQQEVDLAARENVLSDEAFQAESRRLAILEAGISLDEQRNQLGVERALLVDKELQARRTANFLISEGNRLEAERQDIANKRQAFDDPKLNRQAQQNQQDASFNNLRDQVQDLADPILLANDAVLQLAQSFQGALADSILNGKNLLESFGQAAARIAIQVVTSLLVFKPLSAALGLPFFAGGGVVLGRNDQGQGSDDPPAFAGGGVVLGRQDRSSYFPSGDSGGSRLVEDHEERRMVHAFAGGGIVTGSSRIASYDTEMFNRTGTLERLAAGKVVTGPTQALLGEAGSEAVVPLQGGSIPVQIRDKSSVAAGAASAQSGRAMGESIGAILAEKLAAAFPSNLTVDAPIQVNVTIDAGDTLQKGMLARPNLVPNAVAADMSRGGITHTAARLKIGR